MAKKGIEYPIDINISDKFGVSYSSTNPISSYTGDLSILTFSVATSSINILNNISNTKIIWDFGDNTTGYGLSAQHSYRFPGNYLVTCTVFDSDGHPHRAIQPRTVNALNYFPDKVIWKSDNLSNNQNEIVTAGRLSNQLTIERYNSWQHHNSLSATGYTINVYASGSRSSYTSKLQYDNDKNIHFRKMWRFVVDSNNRAPIDNITSSNHELYYKISQGTDPGGILTRCNSTDEGAIFVGTSGQALLYYIDDSRSPQVNLFANLNAGNFSTLENEISNTPRSEYRDLDIDYFNQQPAVLPVKVVSNTPSKLLITSNGLPGFDIGYNKYEKAPIAYTISVADSDDNVIKDFPPLSAGNESQYFRVEHNFVKTPFNQTLHYSNTAINYDQYGSVSFFAMLTGSTLSEYITASCSLYNDVGQYSIHGSSNTFNVWPLSGKYHIAKMSEDYDPTATLQSYILQDTISEKSNFINWFFKEIFGSELSDPEVLGKTVYEKIDNFVENRSDIDVCNVDALYSMAKMVGLDFDNYKYNYPAGIKRLVDILSINQKRLFGFRDNSNNDFDKTGHTLNENSLYGRNLGNIIDTSTYTVTAGVPIIVNQLYGNTLGLINTMVLSGSINTYSLRDYDTSWGWGLTYPSDEDVFKYYDFYEYIDNSTYPLSSNDIVNGVIDFANPLTTIQESDNDTTTWTQKYGLIDNMFDHRLREGLKLFNKQFPDAAIVTAGVKGDDSVAPSPSVTPSISISPTPEPSISVTPSITPTPSVTPSQGLTHWEDITVTWGELINKWNVLNPKIGPAPSPEPTPSISPTPSLSVAFVNWEKRYQRWDNLSQKWDEL